MAYDGALLNAVTTGAVPETLVDQACYRILYTMFRLGTFDQASTLYPIDVQGDDEVARSTEEQAITLLKNRDNAFRSPAAPRRSP